MPSSQRLIFSLVLLAMPLAAAAAPADDTKNAAAAVITAHLTEELNAWDDLTRRTTALQAEARAREGFIDPEREDQNWWNPFWRASVTRQAQRANEIALQLQDLDRQRRELEPPLLEAATRYALQSALNPAQLTSEQAQLWLRADEWRVPRLLDVTSLLAPGQDDAASNPELLALRLRHVEQKRAQLEELDGYLLGRLVSLPREDAKRRVRYEDWLAQLRIASARLVQRIEKLQSLRTPSASAQTPAP